MSITAAITGAIDAAIEIPTIAYEMVQGKPNATRRSSQWPKVRAECIRIQKVCQACGGKVDLTPHHILPFHLFPSLELDLNNLILLCEGDGCNCHFTFGHLLDWRAYNPEVLRDAAEYRSKKKSRLYESN